MSCTFKSIALLFPSLHWNPYAEKYVLKVKVCIIWLKVFLWQINNKQTNNYTLQDGHLMHSLLIILFPITSYCMTWMCNVSHGTELFSTVLCLKGNKTKVEFGCLKGICIKEYEEIIRTLDSY